MSRVHEALRVAETLQKQAPPPSPRQRTTIVVARPTAAMARHIPRPVEEEEEVSEQLTDTVRKAPLSLTARIWRSIRRRLGLRTGGPAPICNGVTRNGLACRAPAMANGYCRAHGGSRSVFTAGTPQQA